MKGTWKLCLVIQIIFIFTDTQRKNAVMSWRKAKWQCEEEQND